MSSAGIFLRLALHVDKNVVLKHIYYKKNENKGNFSLCSGRLFTLTLDAAVVINCSKPEAN